MRAECGDLFSMKLKIVPDGSKRRLGRESTGKGNHSRTLNDGSPHLKNYNIAHLGNPREAQSASGVGVWTWYRMQTNDVKLV